MRQMNGNALSSVNSVLYVHIYIYIYLCIDVCMYVCMYVFAKINTNITRYDETTTTLITEVKNKLTAFLYSQPH